AAEHVGVIALDDGGATPRLLVLGPEQLQSDNRAHVKLGVAPRALASISVAVFGVARRAAGLRVRQLIAAIEQNGAALDYERDRAGSESVAWTLVDLIDVLAESAEVALAGAAAIAQDA